MQLLWKTEWRFLKKLKIELLYDAAFPHLHVYKKERKAITQKDISTVFTTTLFTVAKTWNEPKCLSVVEWIGRLCVCYSEIKRRKCCLNTELTESENKLVVARGRGWSKLVQTSSYKGILGL